MSNVLTMAEMELANRRLLIRQDLNVPVKDGVITNDARIRASIPTLKLALSKGAAVMVMSHLGRPTEGEPEDKFSLQPVAELSGERESKNFVGLLSYSHLGCRLFFLTGAEYPTTAPPSLQHARPHSNECTTLARSTVCILWPTATVVVEIMLSCPGGTSHPSSNGRPAYFDVLACLALFPGALTTLTAWSLLGPDCVASDLTTA